MKLLKFLTIVIFIGSLVAIWILVPKLIKIKTIECKNQYGQCSEAVVKDIEANTLGNLADSKLRLNKAFSNNVLVKEYQLNYKFPDKILVNIVENKPRFALTDKEGNSALIDKSGQALSNVKKTSLPRVYISDALPNISGRVSEDNLFALEIVYDIYSTYQVQSGKITGSSLVIELDSGTKVLFPLEGDRQRLVGALNLIMAELESEKDTSDELGNYNVQTIDLRYKNPVLR